MTEPEGPPRAKLASEDVETSTVSANPDPEWQRLLGDVARGATLAEAPAALEQAMLAGDRIGEYEVVSLLGKGTFGTVYLARQPVIGKQVAIKVLGARFSTNQETVRRFINEARVVNRIKHPNIVDIFDFGELEGGQKYYVMQLLTGETLAQRLNRCGRLEPEAALTILRSIGDALTAAHAHGVVHRDLSAGNVFLAADGEGHEQVKLLDFGVARVPGVGATVATRTGAVFGTPAYMSPEQCIGARAIDHRADIYALGIVAHELFTGQRPFKSKSLAELASMHTRSPPPRLSTSGAPELARLDAVVLQMIEKVPEKRPDSAVGAIQTLELAYRRNTFGKTRNKSLGVVLAVVLVLLLGFLFILLRR